MSNYLSIPYQDLYGVATSFKEQYAEGIPFPHISFPNFFNPDFLEEVLAEFPDLSLLDTYKFKNPNEIKLASKGENGMGPKTREFVHFLNSE